MCIGVVSSSEVAEGETDDTASTLSYMINLPMVCVQHYFTASSVSSSVSKERSNLSHKVFPVTTFGRALVWHTFLSLSVSFYSWLAWTWKRQHVHGCCIVTGSGEGETEMRSSLLCYMADLPMACLQHCIPSYENMNPYSSTA